MTPPLMPHEAWQPLPDSEWNAERARHLLHRAGWSARPAEIERAVRDGLRATIDRLFPTKPPEFAKPRLVARLEQTGLEMGRALRTMQGEERMRAAREVQERSRLAVQELTIKWLSFAAQPETAAFAKWVLFLSDVYVVSTQKVRNAGAVHRHFEILARHALGPAPALTKAMSRSPAMVNYLDLNQSQRKAPNENFARELFELFVLGEGNYTEADIKEAARAFTGYRTRPDGTFRFDPRQHDAGEKTIFGRTGNFSGDAVIDLAYEREAAARFLPQEMARFYLSDAGLPSEHLAALGSAWRDNGFELRALVRTFFGSRLFFADAFRGNFIKSPLQFYLGLMQDLELDVAPLPRLTIQPLRQMGQAVFQPPNVRGWVGGRQWINSSTITARRQFVEMLFAPINERTLNADEQLELLAARTNGITRFTVADESLAPLAELEPAAAANELARRFLAADAVTPVLREQLRNLIAAADAPKERLHRVRRAAVTLLQSPEYQLC